MFADKNHVTAIATAIGTLGGFQAAPEWFNTLSKTSVWNILMATVLVYQGGGALDPMYSLVIAILFYMFVEATKYINFAKGSAVGSEDATVAEDAAPEYYSNYY